MEGIDQITHKPMGRMSNGSLGNCCDGARADREEALRALQGAVASDLLLGQIHLLVDGKRGQQEILAELKTFGITPSQPWLTGATTRAIRTAKTPV